MATSDRRPGGGPKKSPAQGHVAERPRAGDGRSRPSPRRLRLVGLLALATAIVGGGLFVGLRLDDAEGGAGPGEPAPIARMDTPDVHSLVIDPADPDRVLFGSHAGIMESRDGGFTWEDGSLRGKDAMSMATSAHDPTTIYVTGHDVFEVSRDGGATWQPLVHDLPGTDIHAFAQDPLAPSVLYALVAGDGLFRSENGGTNWTPLGSQPPGDSPTALAADGTRVYAAAGGRINVSVDDGAAWQPLTAQPAGAATSLATALGDTLVIYAGTENGLARSDDGGASWAELGPVGVPALALAVAPSDPTRVEFVARGGGVYRSDDGGATWRAPA